jgi:catechol-2,3-dioxygenase
MPKLDRVIETCLYVDNLDRAAGFYEQVLGLKVLTQDERFRAYDVGGQSVLLLFRRGATLKTVHMPGGTIPPHDGHGPLHIAFAITVEALGEWEERLRHQGVTIEGRTEWSRG